jgi:hypothetical protein
LTPTESRYQRNPEFIYRKIADESVLVPIHKDVADMESIYTLNAVGAFIWDLLEEPSSHMGILDAVMNAYDADPEVLTADLENFLHEMIAIDALREI